MPLTDLMQKSNKYEIQSYKKRTDLKELKKTYVPFTGSPQKHPYNHEIVILLIEPYNRNTSYYEFKTKDIFHVEELPNVTNLEGETVTMVRIWVKKKSVALRCAPFFVEDLKI
ncbi:MAG: inorganic pyrophosphatase Ppa [Spirochaetes bacterium]|nr:inorganic pyrophosphatase Ppa [Spirochaetota bacterium]